LNEAEEKLKKSSSRRDHALVRTVVVPLRRMSGWALASHRLRVSSLASTGTIHYRQACLRDSGDEPVWEIVRILLMILLPLAWGLGSDFVFAKLRHGKAPAKGTGGASE